MLPARVTIRVGISGWRYAPWRGVSYPSDLPQRAELIYAAQVFSTLEIKCGRLRSPPPVSAATA